VSVDVDALTLADLGVPETSTAVIDPVHVERIAGTLDAPPVAVGERLPSLWHWAFFTPTATTESLGPDGHPRLASAALAGHPRRMWGAGVVSWSGDLVVGATVNRTSRIAAAKHTEGSSGSLVIVTVEHRYTQNDRDAILETQSLVYRTPGASVPAPAESDEIPAAPDGVTQRRRQPTTPLLFRFSAITFNSHRIHYDAAYALSEEGYPGLVVHGPLTSLLLAEHVEATTRRRLTRWDFKATAPMFADHWALDRCGSPDTDGTGEASVLRCDGAVAMQARYALGADRG
jgi:3-methylfumaryl-CoA hydratase